MIAHITGIASEPGYTVVENAPLQGRNTFRVPARAELLIDVSRPAALPGLFDLAALKNGKVLVLGAGSNVLFTRDWPGVVLALPALGIRLLQNRGDAALIRVEAGENWNDFVHWSLGHGFVGLENLALIPGTVGAAPIQNIGAYGVEVCEFIDTVEIFDRAGAKFTRLGNADCAFAYRDSLFRRTPGRYLVTAVEFLLQRARELRLDYAGVREELAAMGIATATAPLVAEAVSRLRLRKLPNPAMIGNAGSFFKNPVVKDEIAQQLRVAHPTLPLWPAASGHKKLSAAWLIEACGFKGLREGDAGVSSQHALVLVNHGHATGAQIWALAQRILQSVQSRFGIALEPEPIVI
ncbi:MAG: UDP-N-acetylmuramate dehydrogenase [Rudaea sp.]|nr:UDP-N-acetylmuramate dehydrogenase [Rudaea sp.]